MPQNRIVRAIRCYESLRGWAGWQARGRGFLYQASRNRYGGARCPRPLRSPSSARRASARRGAGGFDTRKATALLAYLALAERPRSREALCELLWPGHDPDHARGALRRTLSTIRKAAARRARGRGRHRGALGRAARGRRAALPRARGGRRRRSRGRVEVFRGEPLEGFGVRDSAGFDAWHALEADTLQRELGAVLARRVGSSRSAASPAARSTRRSAGCRSTSCTSRPIAS